MLFIHIGAPKTGSTSIQDFCNAQADALAARGVLYPEIGRGGRDKHQQLKFEIENTAGAGGPHWQALRELRAREPDRPILISDEMFWELEPPLVAQLGALAGPGPVAIVAYVREHRSHVRSLYFEETQRGRNGLDFDAYFDEYLARADNFERIGRWAAVFGWEHARIRSFHRDHLVGGDVLSDLLTVLGLDPAGFAEATAAERRRAAISWQALEATRALGLAFGELGGKRRGGRIPADIRSKVVNALDGALPVAGPAEYLTRDQRARCDAATRRDVAALNAVLPAPGLALQDFADSPERPFLPGIAQVPSAGLITAFAQALQDAAPRGNAGEEAGETGDDPDRAARTSFRERKRAERRGQRERG